MPLLEEHLLVAVFASGPLAAGPCAAIRSLNRRIALGGGHFHAGRGPSGESLVGEAFGARGASQVGL